jgi:hypothetical protein
MDNLEKLWWGDINKQIDQKTWDIPRDTSLGDITGGGVLRMRGLSYNLIHLDDEWNG